MYASGHACNALIMLSCSNDSNGAWVCISTVSVLIADCLDKVRPAVPDASHAVAEAALTPE